jgi:glycosyltransferase involved in cell wall biosynthesis
VRQHLRALLAQGVVVTDFPQPFGAESLLGQLPSGKKIREIPSVWLRAGYLEARQAASIARKALLSHRYDVTWLSREMYAGYLTGEILLKKPLIFDVDDAIWLNEPMGSRVSEHVARRAKLIIAGNNYIAEWFSAINSNIEVIPTAVDTDTYTPAPRNRDDFTIGWIGTSSNFDSLNLVADPIRRFLEKFRGTRFLVVSDKRPALMQKLPDRVVFRSWSESAEVSDIASFDIGIMPLIDNKWSRGKCSFKMLQYMACGVPFVASPVGMNGQIIRDHGCGIAAVTGDDWYGAISALYQDQQLREELATKGRNTVCKEFSSHRIAQRLAEVFRRAV